MKRLVLCADGTWNNRDQLDKRTKKHRPTNVTKLARAVRPKGDDGIDQVVFYCDGVGTEGGLDRFTGGAFGDGIEDNVRALYRDLVYNYVPGDEIYLFGFSRGAFTVRTLAGFLKFLGLLEKDDDYYVPELYGCYETRKGPGTPQWTHAHRNVKGVRPCPPIRMIGVWDTVGSLGAPGLLGQLFNPGKYKCHDVALSETIQHAYHALAIDERRKPFAPNLWRKPAGWTGVLEQVWFAGVHCNIGGGYTPDGLANIALHWMVDKASALGLAFDDAYLAHFEPHHDSVLQDSMTLLYRAIGRHERPVAVTQDACESIHPTVRQRMQDPDCRYRPNNVKAEGLP